MLETCTWKDVDDLTTKQIKFHIYLLGNILENMEHNIV